MPWPARWGPAAEPALGRPGTLTPHPQQSLHATAPGREHGLTRQLPSSQPLLRRHKQGVALLQQGKRVPLVQRRRRLGGRGLGSTAPGHRISANTFGTANPSRLQSPTRMGPAPSLTSTSSGGSFPSVGWWRRMVAGVPVRPPRRRLVVQNLERVALAGH